MALGAGASALADDSTVAMRSGAVRSVWPRGQSYDGLLDHANQAVWGAYLARQAKPDPLYPSFHLRTSPSQWENDPAAIITMDGSYHVFGETNPFGDLWGAMSLSYVRQDPNYPYKWRYPVHTSGPQQGRFNVITLVPTPGSGDRDGVFSGSGGVFPVLWSKDADGAGVDYAPMIFYSGVWGSEEATQEQVFLAMGEPDRQGNLTRWTKYPSNDKPQPLISQPKLGLTSFRDPYVFQHGDSYYLLISGGLQREAGPHGCILLYRSNDLIHWSRVNQGDRFFFEAAAFVKDPLTGRGDFETPVLFRLTDHAGAISDNEPWVLILGQDGNPDAGHEKAVYYSLGFPDFEHGRFRPLDEFQGSDGKPLLKPLDLNPAFVFYAPRAMTPFNEQRHYLLGWLMVNSETSEHWAGALSTPRWLFAYQTGTETQGEKRWALGQEPVLVDSLETTIHPERSLPLSGGPEKPLALSMSGDGKPLRSRRFGLKATFSDTDPVSASGPFGLVVAADDKAQGITIAYEKGRLRVGDETAKLAVPNDRLTLQVYVDGYILEVFVRPSLDLPGTSESVEVGTHVWSAQLPLNQGADGIYAFGPQGVELRYRFAEMQSLYLEEALPAAAVDD